MIEPLERPISLGACATLACIWEATAPKPGNVYRGADFEDLTYADFLTSATLIGPVIDKVGECGVGKTVLHAVEVTRNAVATNTNLGILLLLAPLAAVDRSVPLQVGIPETLKQLTSQDAEQVYEAIRLAQPAGLGEVDEADVNQEDPPGISLLEAMQLAEERDSIAGQYVNSFTQVFELAGKIESHQQAMQALSPAIVRAFVEHLASYPDSLIARKCGVALAREVSLRAAEVVSDQQQYDERLAEFDFWLRAAGHRRNPGTTADFIAAALFVLLRENKFRWPVKFY